MISRRGLLRGTAGLATLPLLPRSLQAQAEGPQLLEARPAQAQIAPEGYPKTDVWSYGGALPGAEIRVAQGSRLTRKLVNSLPAPTSVHWHGIRIDNAMDGVPGVTQKAVQPGETFLYDFDVKDAGTYWYHSHNQSFEQVARGLHGPLIVEESDPPDVDRDEVLVLDDFRLDPETGQIASFENMHDFSHGGRVGNIAVTNGVFNATLTAEQNERLRLRLINVANAKIFELELRGLEGWVVALDGMPLDSPIRISERLLLAPAQRADLIVDVTAEPGAEAHLVRFEGDEGYSQVLFSVREKASDSRRDPPLPLPPNPDMAVTDLDDAMQSQLRMEGGAMRGFASAHMNGREVGFREAAQSGKFWALNGTLGMPDAPLFVAERGQTVRVMMQNDTVFPHAMHLHGHHFREVLPGGGLGPLRDTLLMFADERREIAFVAHNPGDWVFHCHMLTHAASGMMTRIKVLA
ncbi:multicopper oxidase family protein [Tropicimonas marinistellae]|uniref:multicopper oxidase family protein n=1 Tax=Tropicimonas marinistellae TaxID=1739787 RepID=UPI0008309831|nr:multicopper oxidase family protein [Tropicimonas marinistellae]